MKIEKITPGHYRFKDTNLFEKGWSGQSEDGDNNAVKVVYDDGTEHYYAETARGSILVSTDKGDEAFAAMDDEVDVTILAVGGP